MPNKICSRCKKPMGRLVRKGFMRLIPFTKIYRCSHCKTTKLRWLGTYKPLRLKVGYPRR